jgi:hypothetical protein
MAIFNLMGIEIPLAYTIGAKKELLEEFGTADKLQAAFAVTSDVELAENAAKIGSIMAKAELTRQRAEHMLLGTEITAREISAEDLFALLDIEKTLELIEAISSSVREANKTQFQIQETNGKKAEATQE